MAEEEGVKTVADQIDDMLNIGDVKPEEPSVEDPPVEEPPAEEPPVEPPVEESSVEPSAEEPPAEPPVEEPEDELTKSKKEVESLRKTIEEMSTPKPEPEPEPEPVKPAEPTPSPEPKVEEIDFVGDADMDEVTRDPKEFNKLLNKVFVQGGESLRNQISEGVLRSIPDIVKTNVATVISLRESSEQFYKDNEDLKPFKKVVGAVFEEVAAENPDKKFSEILDDVSTKTRERLELYKKAVNKEPEPEPESKPPGLPKLKGQHRETNKKPDISPMQAEIDAMNESNF